MLLLKETTQNSRLQPHLRTQMQVQMKMPAIKDRCRLFYTTNATAKQNTLARSSSRNNDNKQPSRYRPCFTIHRGSGGQFEVLSIKIKAVALNYRDIAISTGLYPFPVKTNVVPYSDASGEVLPW